jgi:hypothetical protein
MAETDANTDQQQPDQVTLDHGKTYLPVTDPKVREWIRRRWKQTDISPEADALVREIDDMTLDLAEFDDISDKLSGFYLAAFSEGYIVGQKDARRAEG